MPELVTIPNITLIETGTWQASTGEVTFTSSHLYAAVAALDDPAVKTPRMRFGHTPPGTSPYESAGQFQEQPCVGKFTNLRVEDEGNSLVADLVGVPKWLADILPIAYPNRSVEAFFGVNTSTGKKHDMIVTSVALLGENLPGVQTLEDLEVIFSDDGSEEWINGLTATDKVAASHLGGDPLPTRVAASVDTGDIRSAFYEQIATEESGRYWWWLHQVYIDPAVVIAEDDDGEFWLIPYDAKSAEMGDPTQVFIQWVEKDSGKVAASVQLPKEYGQATAVWTEAKASRPAARQIEFNNNKEARASMPIDTSLLCAKLGLPADASEEQINAALEAHAEETPPVGSTPGETPVEETPREEENPPAEEGGDEGDDEEPEVEGGEAQASGVMVDRSAWAETTAYVKKQKAKERDEFVSAAVKAGKIPPARKAHYLTLMERDESGTTEFINNLEAGAVPVTEIGTSEDVQASAAQGTGLFPELQEA